MSAPDLSDMPSPVNGAEVYLRAILAELRALRGDVPALPGSVVELRGSADPRTVSAVEQALAKSARNRPRV